MHAEITIIPIPKASARIVSILPSFALDVGEVLGAFVGTKVGRDVSGDFVGSIVVDGVIDGIFVRGGSVGPAATGVEVGGMIG